MTVFVLRRYHTEKAHQKCLIIICIYRIIIHTIYIIIICIYRTIIHIIYLLYILTIYHLMGTHILLQVHKTKTVICHLSLFGSGVIVYTVVWFDCILSFLHQVEFPFQLRKLFKYFIIIVCCHSIHENAVNKAHAYDTT